jgi:hypothetical protein
MVYFSLSLRKFAYALILILFATGLAAADENNYSEAVSGGGTLSYTVSTTSHQCSYWSSSSDSTVTDFIYTSTAGVKSAVRGYYVWRSANGCQNGQTSTEAYSTQFPLPTIPQGSNCYIEATILGNPTNLVLTCPGYAGSINPKYVVVGVTYAPPGSSSYVQYTNTTSVGNTTTISNSFSNDVGFSISSSAKGSFSAGYFFDGTFTTTATESTDYTQESNSSKTTTISKASTVAYKTSGTPTEAPVNSDYDYIWLWLNPELFINYTPPAGSSSGSIVLTGYGMDPNDPATGLPQTGVAYTAGPDVIEVQVGCLNGDFTCGSDLGWDNGEAPGSFVTSGLLARRWQSTANGYHWPSGEQSGLSFSDVCQILTFDPFATTPSQCTTQNDYTLANSLPSITSDGRFSKLPYPPNPIQYPVGGANESYSMVQTNTQSESTGNSTQIKQAFSVSEDFGSTSFWGLTSNTISFKESDTLIWNYSTLNTLTTTTTLTNALSITGPPDSPTYPANEPVEFIGYQDNTFGTFAFVPIDYCPSSTSILCTE